LWIQRQSKKVKDEDLDLKHLDWSKVKRLTWDGLPSLTFMH